MEKEYDIEGMPKYNLSSKDEVADPPFAKSELC
jgi:hypothetical protein